MKFLWIGLAGLGAWLFATKTDSGRSLLTKGRAMLTPARAAIHGQLMGHELQPEKLEKAAFLFSREGLHTCAAQLRDKAKTIDAQIRAAIDLVERARAGDQNAMAMIAACREQSKAGNKRAFVTCQCIERYCLNNPVKDDGPSGHAETS